MNLQLNKKILHLQNQLKAITGFDAIAIQPNSGAQGEYTGLLAIRRFHAAMASAQHIVKLKPTAVELVDRTMIELARANPAFRPVIERALIGKPEAILLVEFAGEERDPQLADLKRLVELMADLGLPGSVVEMPEPGPQAALWAFCAFYVTCIAVTWFVYTRPGGLLHDIERGAKARTTPQTA